jgi:hypothetical protein
MDGAATARRDEIGKGVIPVRRGLHSTCMRKRKQAWTEEVAGLRFGAARP